MLMASCVLDEDPWGQRHCPGVIGGGLGTAGSSTLQGDNFVATKMAQGSWYMAVSAVTKCHAVVGRGTGMGRLLGNSCWALGRGMHSAGPQTRCLSSLSSQQ